MCGVWEPGPGAPPLATGANDVLPQMRVKLVVSCLKLLISGLFGQKEVSVM